MTIPPHKIGRSLGVFLTAALVLALAPAGRSAPGSEGGVRDAFQLGFNFGFAHLLYARNTALPASVRVSYDRLMATAQAAANKLAVKIDVNPPPTDPASASPNVEILKAGSHRIELINIQVKSRRGDAAAAAVELGFKSAVAIEYVPFLEAAAQAQVAETYRRLAKRCGLPVSVVDAYSQLLQTTSDRRTLISAMSDFSDTVLRHFEDRASLDPSVQNRQLNVWLCGWKLGLAAVGQSRGADAAAVEGLFEESRVRAELLDIQLPVLPEQTGQFAKDGSAAIYYLQKEVGENVVDQLKTKYGLRSAALFTLAIKSTLLLLLYGPGDDLGQSLASAIENAGRQSALPAESYQRVVALVRNRSSYDAVKNEVGAMNQAIESHFADPGRP